MLGVVVLAAGFALPASVLARALRLAGLQFALGSLTAWLQWKVGQLKDKDLRLQLRSALWVASGAVLLVMIGLFAAAVSGTRSDAQQIVDIGLYILVYGSPFAFLAAWAITTMGTGNTIAATLLLSGFLFLLPPSIVLLVTTGQHPAYWLGPQTNGAAEEIPLIGVPALLVVGPQIIRQRLTRDEMSKFIKSLLPDALANVAAAATSVYAVVLHFWNGPLAKTPISTLAIATLVVSVFLRPLYKSIAVGCLTGTTLEIVLLRGWRLQQARLLRALRTTFSGRGEDESNIRKEASMTGKEDSGTTHAYVALERLDSDRVRAYVGIGTNKSRAFEPHTESVDQLLKNAFATFGTARPFTTREDAELAEALTIQALVKAGLEVGNKQKTVSPSDIHPLLDRRPGVVAYSRLQRTFVVKVGADKIGEGVDARDGAVGFDPAKVSKRCDRYWDLGKAVRDGYEVDRLVAVLLGAPKADTPIVGCWATEPVTTWDAAQGIVKLRDPTNWNLDGWRGMRLDWEGRHPQKQQWSDDLGQ